MALLEGVRVLDLTRLLPGPYCTWILSKMGADVLKVEDPKYDDYTRNTPLYELINTGKKSMTLNLKSDAGKEIFLDLVSGSDVLVEGFRPGVMKRLGLDYETIRENNEKIIFCSISGYGQDGPYRDVPGHDINYISRSGLLGINRTKESPMIPPMQAADIGGGMFSALSILAALYRRTVSGKGEYIDVSMMDVASCLFDIEYFGVFRGDQAAVLNGDKTFLTGAFPCYNIYKTKDGGFVSIGTLEPKFWRDFCTGIGREDLIERQNDASAIADLERIFIEKTRDEWMETFRSVMITPVYSPEEVFKDPQVMHRGVFDGENMTLNLPVKFIENAGVAGKKAPEMGENTSEVLMALGYKKEKVEELREKRVV